MPGFHYLGPGNEVRHEYEELETLDRIAKQHDIEYEEATSGSAIRISDWRATLQFGYTALVATCAAVVLLVKLLLEAVLQTPLYPFRLFNIMDLLGMCVIFFCLCWLYIIDYRLSSVMSGRGAVCASESTWRTLECMLRTNSY